jgi:hypothetical protein
MAWPKATDFIEAVQDLAVAVEDEELRGGEVARTPLGLPMLWSGNFADVFKIHCRATGNTWALKCFTRQVPGQRDRYRHIAACLEEARLPFTVPFVYLDRGIQVGGQWFPAVKMEWVEGLTLAEFVEEHLDRPGNLKMLLDLWVKLASRLREAEVAHADLQHGNVLLVPASGSSLALRLVDYDGMYVPSLAGTRSGEVGHPAYQHPQRLREGTYNGEVDRFSHLAIYTAVRCLMLGRRELWQRFNNGDNLLFREEDFRTPGESKLFRVLWKNLPDADARALLGRMVLACGARLEEAPLLDEVLEDGRVLPLSSSQEAAVSIILAPTAKLSVKSGSEDELLSGSPRPLAADDHAAHSARRGRAFWATMIPWLSDLRRRCHTAIPPRFRTSGWLAIGGAGLAAVSLLLGIIIYVATDRGTIKREPSNGRANGEGNNQEPPAALVKKRENPFLSHGLLQGSDWIHEETELDGTPWQPTTPHDPEYQLPNVDVAVFQNNSQETDDVENALAVNSKLNDFAFKPIKARAPGGDRAVAFDSRGSDHRAAMLGRYGGTKQSERAVAGALHWLMRHQAYDGSWSFNKYKTQCKDGSCSGVGGAQADAGATGMALLCYLSAGQTHKTKGPYRRNIEQALIWLVRHQERDGNLANGCVSPMYSHGIATMALCEAFGLSGDKNVGEATQGAVNFIIAAQNKNDYGWGYNPGDPGDTSVVGWQIMALKGAQMAGLTVGGTSGTASVFDLAGKWLDRVKTGPNDSQFQYQPGASSGEYDRRANVIKTFGVGATPTMSAVGLLCRQYLHAKRTDPMMVDGVKYLMQNFPDLKVHNCYYWYYASQVLHNYSGYEWDTWNRAMRKLLITTQTKTANCANGSWDPENPSKDKWGPQGGRLMTTALSCLTLEIYYRYLPLYKVDAEYTGAAVAPHAAATPAGPEK